MGKKGKGKKGKGRDVPAPGEPRSDPSQEAQEGKKAKERAVPTPGEPQAGPSQKGRERKDEAAASMQKLPTPVEPRAGPSVESEKGKKAKGRAVPTPGEPQAGPSQKGREQKDEAAASILKPPTPVEPRAGPSVESEKGKKAKGRAVPTPGEPQASLKGRERKDEAAPSVPKLPTTVEPRAGPSVESQKVMKEDSAKPASATEVTSSFSQDHSSEALLSQLVGLKLEPEQHKYPVSGQRKIPLAERPKNGYGRINERNHIQLFVNYFRLDYKNVAIYHYDIDISDSTKDNKKGRSLLSEGRTLKADIQHNVKHVERQKRRNIGKAKCREIISGIFRTNETLKKFQPVYDGQKNIFTSQPLPCKKETVFPIDICIEGKTKRFFVTITPVEKEDKTNIISLEPLKNLYSHKSSEIPQEVLLVYETILNHREPPLNQVQFRKSFFYLGGQNENLGFGLEIWTGYHQHVQLTERGPVVVINLAAKAFHKSGPVIDYANDVLSCDIRKLPVLQRYLINNLTQALKGVQIKVLHQKYPRRYKIKAVTDKSAKEINLDVDNKRMTVVQYFLEKYKMKLSYPHLPCLLMQTNTNTTYIPMETCVVIEGQPKIGKLDAELTSRMIRSTAVDPQRRMNEISKNAREVNNISKTYMNAFGLFMDVNLIKVDGRIMAAPQLAYAGGVEDKSRIAKPDCKGVWRIEDGKNFFKVAKIDKWVVISFADERKCGYDTLSKYCKFLVQSGRKCGMSIDRPLSIQIFNRGDKTENVIRQAKKSGAQMAIVILNRRDIHHTYDEVKFLADFKYNLVTQCMEDKTLFRINDQITTNVCLKINVKLGGINHVLLQKPQIFNQPMTVLGVDAIHWTRGYGYPSIVAVVASLNPSATRYALTCDLQRNEKQEKISQEIIRNMKGISMPVLKKFVDVNGIMPRKIVVFRDGVSDGQFQHAVDYEVSGLQEACQELWNKILPITYLVVQKRHQTRFRPVNPAQGAGRNKNVPPGTCVDKDITHPVYFDYFICSHEGIQGTSKPAHYTVLHDDNRLHCEELQQLCYFFCHTYVRCTRSVSLPAPVMYADLAAARAKKYADLFTSSDTASTAGSDDTQKDLPPDVVSAIRGMKSFDNNMFYV